MISKYELDTEDEAIISELDNMFGVVQNKEILRDLITYIKLRQDNQLDFGNYNIIIRNQSSYDLMDNLLKICAKIFTKYGIISNDKICYLDKLVTLKEENPLEKIWGLDDGIVVINERKLNMNYSDSLDAIKKMITKLNNKVFIFPDKSFCEGCVDAELGEVANFRLTIEPISLDDKITYCKNRLEEYGIKYKKQDLNEFADVPFWVLKNMMQKLLIECKSMDIKYADKNVLIKNRDFFKNIKKQNSRSNKRNKTDKKTAQEELDELIGLDDAKRQMKKILNYIKINKDRGKMPALHMCFTGNPGTGKTSIARIIGKVFEEEKILSGSGGFVEIHGRDLIGQFVGWTAVQVHEKVSSAIGGVLFIDEAYSLIPDRLGGYEDEAIATLIKEMEDHRDEICIILAGYTDEMKKLIELNPGFESRIPFTINFPDYSEDELLEIFKSFCKKEKYILPQNYKDILIENFRKAKTYKNFGNGRYIRNLFEKIKFEQADRVVLTNSKGINQITKSDIENAIKIIELTNKSENARPIGFMK